MAPKSREEGEIGSESREKGDLPPCSPPLVKRQAGAEVSRFEVSSLEGFFFRSQQLTYKIVYTCID